MSTGRLFDLGDGWYRWEPAPHPEVELRVRIQPSPSGRMVVAGVHLEGPVGSDVLRSVPLGRIEACANAQLGGWSTAMRSAAPATVRPAPAVRTSDGGWEPPSSSERIRGAALVGAAAALASPLGAGAAAGAALAAGAARRRGKPDAFYRGIADEYRDLSSSTSRPAVEIATRHDVPVSTAHRWVKEARRRGFLPPGQAGKAG